MMTRWLLMLLLAGSLTTAHAETMETINLLEENFTLLDDTAGDPFSTEAEPTDLEPPTEPERDLPMVTIRTSQGDIRLELYPDKAPLTVENFLAYVDSGHYSGTIFHRVIKNFMIQGGGFTPDFHQKSTRDPIKNEASNGLTNDRGTIAMARTQVLDSATSQFFINVIDNANLNYPAAGGYCVFGRVVEGMDVVDAIRAVETGSRGSYRDVPVEPVEIIDVVREG